MQEQQELEKQRDEILSTTGYDSRYYSAKGIASKATELMAIKNSSVFKTKADFYKDIMLESLWGEYFSTGGDGMLERDISITNKTVKGHIFGKGKYLFKIDSELTNAGVLTEITIFVKVENGIITQLYTQ